MLTLDSLELAQTSTKASSVTAELVTTHTATASTS